MACYFFLGFFTVFALCLNASAVGDPALPVFLMRSPEPAAILSRLALMLAYSPGFSFMLLFSPSREYPLSVLWLLRMLGSWRR